MGNVLKKKYGFFTAVSMVIGIVMGSGVFFKAEKVLEATKGNILLGVFAWILGGTAMISCAYTFSVMASKYEYVNGIVDYADYCVGKKYGYFVGWFMSVIYYPTLVAALSWVSARYTCVLFGFPAAGAEAMLIAGFFMIMSYTVNVLSPVIAGKIQVSTTVIKLIPILLMAVIGIITGILNSDNINLQITGISEEYNSGMLFEAVVATAFAYEGWIVATSINSEIKNAKKNLPRALVAGTLSIIIIYVLYYLGLTGSVGADTLISNGESGVKIAFEHIFPGVGGYLLFIFVIISCLGTLNGITLGCTRGFYSLAARKEGIKPDLFSQVDKITDMPVNSSVIGLFISFLWIVFFFGTELSGEWFGNFRFDMTELPVISIYALYIPIFIMFMIKEKKLNIFKRFFMPSISVTSCLFMIAAAFYAHKNEILYYMAAFIIIMGIGWLFLLQKKYRMNIKNY